jgi:hypothetical protein
MDPQAKTQMDPRAQIELLQQQLEENRLLNSPSGSEGDPGKLLLLTTKERGKEQQQLTLEPPIFTAGLSWIPMLIHVHLVMIV